MISNTAKLESLCSLIADCPHSTPVWTRSGYIVLRNQNIKAGRLDLSTPSYTDAMHYLHRIRRAKPTVGDIIITREAPMGDVCMIPERLECCLGQRQVLLRPDATKINGRYLLFTLQASLVQRQIGWNDGTGSTVSNLRIPVLKALDIPIPIRRVQDFIASLLGGLDDKIDLNRRMNETLEAMARTIFKDWFVDFGPTRAKAEARQRYLDHELWAQFPDALDDKGRPKGWHEMPLLDHARLISGGTPKTDIAEYWQGSIAWASAKDVSQCRDPFIVQTERTISQRGLDNSSTRMVPRLATVVVARGATTGRFCMLGREMAMNQTCYALHSINERPFWLNLAFAHLVNDLVHSAHGSVFDTITTRTIESARVIVANGPVMRKFEKLITPLFERALSNVNESFTLTELRNLLLPKLISGEIHLRDAEQLVEQVA